MVLRLKTRKSRSPPGLRKTDTSASILLHNFNNKTRRSEMTGGFCDSGAQYSKIRFGNLQPLAIGFVDDRPAGIRCSNNVLKQIAGPSDLSPAQQ